MSLISVLYVTCCQVPAGPSSPASGSATISINSTLITALAIGIPSLIVAIGTYWLSTRARGESMDAYKHKVDAEAYTRAKDLYESAITALRKQAQDLRDELAEVRLEVEDMRRKLREIQLGQQRRRPQPPRK
jgi:predicted RNase H-like nuclease (RuvC/YqgF family)